MTTTTAARKTELAEYRRIDNILAEMWGELHDVERAMNSIVKDIERNVQYANAKYNQSEERQLQYADRIAKAETELGKLRPVREEKRDAAIQFNDANYTGWPRFFHVVHIHKSMHCSSFRPTTRIGWLPDVSGLTPAEAVAAHGETLCTICYPDAPVALTTKAVDPNQCEGSGKGYSREHKTGREHNSYGRSGYCPVCLRWQTVTASGVMRKHKANDETRRHALDKR